MSIFTQVPVNKIRRSSHNLSHQVRASFDYGKIVPIMTELAYPGDSWRVNLEQFIRTMPLTAPVMDMLDVKVDAFFVPLRLIWDDFEDFITLGMTGEFDAAWPTVSITKATVNAAELPRYLRVSGIGGLADYLNFSTNIVPVSGQSFARTYDALPFRAYQFIYNEYFLNENLDTPIPLITSSGDTALTNVEAVNNQSVLNFVLKNRGWRKDYFTSALPYPQKGPRVLMPTEDINIIPKSPDGAPQFRTARPETPPSPDDPEEVGIIPDGQGGGLNPQQYWKLFNTTDEEALKWADPGLTLDRQNFPDIEELRYAEVLQEFYEAQARGGSRPKEYYLNIWNTRTKDARLDRPEYLGGYRGPITISDIDQTSQSATTAQGTLAGKGVSAGGNKLFKYHTTEFGIIMVTMSVTTKSAYYQGDRRWNMYRDVFDIPNPFFANLGEQEIYNGEVFYQGTDDDRGTFGYTPRYAEGKFIPDSIHGQFRSTLEYWHLGRKFSSLPNLNSAFVHTDPSEISRIFPDQVANNDKFLGTFFFHVKRNMGLPYYGVPRLLHSI